jgi:outer membrane receptor protein involved in Fe transport
VAKIPISDGYHVKEVFGEIRIPLIEQRPLIEQLAFEGGIRYSDYSNSGGVTTFKLGGDWVPVNGLRLRGGFQHAVRAPNVTELFAQQRKSFSVTTDPCEGTAPTATFEQCARTGLISAQYGQVPSSGGTGLGTIIGGNPDLEPETSNSWTAGVQLNPVTVRRLNISIDYFNIKVKKLIGTIPISLTLSQCLATGDPYFCSLIHRDSGSGSLVSAADSYIVNTNLNTGSLATDGVDVAVKYAQSLEGLLGSNAGELGFDFAGTYTGSYRVQSLPSSTASYDCTGYFGTTCGQPTPDWRHRFVLSWTSASRITIMGTWRYIGGTKNNKSSSNPQLTGSYQPYDGKIPVVSYFDIGISFNVANRFTLRAGVNNLLDRDPPLTASVGGVATNGTFFSGMYDSLGRYAFVGTSVRF